MAPGVWGQVHTQSSVAAPVCSSQGIHHQSGEGPSLLLFLGQRGQTNFGKAGRFPSEVILCRFSTLTTKVTSTQSGSEGLPQPNTGASLRRVGPLPVSKSHADACATFGLCSSKLQNFPYLYEPKSWYLTGYLCLTGLHKWHWW